MVSTLDALGLRRSRPYTHILELWCCLNEINQVQMLFKVCMKQTAMKGVYIWPG